MGSTGTKETKQFYIAPNPSLSANPKFKQFNKKEQEEIADIDYDSYNGVWNIVLRHHDRVISEETWADVKWELKQMVKRNDYTLEW